MCGIVGAVAERNVVPLLLEGLRRLEYRGYDSAGLAVVDGTGLHRVRTVGKVAELERALNHHPLTARLGIAHTRWATHGRPSERNAHPHLGGDTIAVVHNGIIENHEALREGLRAAGVECASDTDSEVVAHWIALERQRGRSLVEAVRRVARRIEGTYALGVVDAGCPGQLVGARRGSPLVVGLGIGEHFLASDIHALLPVTQRVLYLEDGDVVQLETTGFTVWDMEGRPVQRDVREVSPGLQAAERGPFRHFMAKEIFEQPNAVAETLEGRLTASAVPPEILGPDVDQWIDSVRTVQIVACGTSYHAGLVAKYWMEGLAGLPCHVEVASEYRYRRQPLLPGNLLITVSQSGETADTLAALRKARNDGAFLRSLCVCNVPESSLVRESDSALMTHAGPEIGVASTKAFTTQLVALLLVVLVLGRRLGRLDPGLEAEVVALLRHLPARIEAALALDGPIMRWAQELATREHALFLGRGVHYPVAMEGALKLKEISYIHAEAYAAGELKHGPLALVDAEMPVIAVAPNDELLKKLESNLQEVRSRGGALYVFADENSGIRSEAGVQVLNVAPTEEVIAPVVFTVPLQLLAYHTAVLKGTDVDQPRNLAKSVTVE